MDGINHKDKMGCTCQECGNKYKVDFIIPDDLWEKIKLAGKGSGAGMLCGKCICAKIEEIGEFDSFEIIKT